MESIQNTFCNIYHINKDKVLKKIDGKYTVYKMPWRACCEQTKKKINGVFNKTEKSLDIWQMYRYWQKFHGLCKSLWISGGFACFTDTAEVPLFKWYLKSLQNTIPKYNI